MGMTNNQIALVLAVAQNRYEEAKKIALACCNEDNTKKNEYNIKKCRKILETQDSEVLKLPQNITGMAVLEDVSNFQENRYYLQKREAELFEYIQKMTAAGMKLTEMGIPYLNSILLTGESGTGKTMFARYTAYKLGLPFLYINFSYLIDSFMGKTGQNLRNVFSFAKQNRCLLMLDEIDSIAKKRNGNSEGAAREYSNCTVTLLQELDQIKGNSVVMAATNIPQTIDQAVARRFVVHHEVEMLTEPEIYKLVMKWLGSVGMWVRHKEVPIFARKFVGKPQSAIVNELIQHIADAVMKEKECVSLISEEDLENDRKENLS